MLIKTDNTQALYNALDRINTLEAALDVAREALLFHTTSVHPYGSTKADKALQLINQTLGRAGL
jgi:hypothetical protein